MHLLSWNTNHWQRRHHHAELWDYLNGLNPDIALLQEAYPPVVNSEDVVVKKAGVKLSNSGNYVWHEIGGNRKWGSDKTDIPWQLDHCFVSKNLFNKVEKAEVLYNETIEKLSDHNPLSIKLNIS